MAQFNKRSASHNGLASAPPVLLTLLQQRHGIVVPGTAWCGETTFSIGSW